MTIPVTSYRICRNCDRLVAEHEDGNYHKPHACFTLSYLAGFVLGAMPSHLESPMKLALSPLGLEDDETFAIGYRAGMARNEAIGIEQMSTSQREVERLTSEASFDGYRQGCAEYRAPIDTCHCGDTECGAPKFQFPQPLYIQPCHCNADGCIEIGYVESRPHGSHFESDAEILGHVSRERHLAARSKLWWERTDDEAETS